MAKREEISELFEKWFKQEEIRYEIEEPESGCSCYRAGFRLNCKIGRVNLFIRIDNVACNIYVFGDQYVDDESTPELLKYINKINDIMRYGHFLISDEHVECRYYFRFDEDTVVSHEYLGQNVYTLVEFFEEFGDGFARLLVGVSSAEEEFALAMSYEDGEGE